jgi:hypothetical protein
MAKIIFGIWLKILYFMPSGEAHSEAHDTFYVLWDVFRYFLVLNKCWLQSWFSSETSDSGVFFSAFSPAAGSRACQLTGIQHITIWITREEEWLSFSTMNTSTFIHSNREMELMSIVKIWSTLWLIWGLRLQSIIISALRISSRLFSKVSFSH